uniref:Uncharacterized protein n=1 Tax=Fagus sylvatica TaxID=28930 RepID=A0A2N9GHR6_FAGSY
MTSNPAAFVSSSPYQGKSVVFTGDHTPLSISDIGTISLSSRSGNVPHLNDAMLLPKGAARSQPIYALDLDSPLIYLWLLHNKELPDLRQLRAYRGQLFLLVVRSSTTWNKQERLQLLPASASSSFSSWFSCQLAKHGQHLRIPLF